MTELTAPEYATILADGRPREADVARAALVDLLARRALRLVPWQPQGRLPERLLVAGPTPEHELPAVLRPARVALGAALGTADVDGGPAVLVRDWAGGLSHVTEGHGYLDGVVRPALIGAGLLDRVRRRFWPGTRWGLTAEGQAVRERAAGDVARARTAVEAGTADRADPLLVGAAAAALGALGVLALADRDLVAALVDLRRRDVPTEAGAGDVTFVSYGGFDTGPDGDHDLFDGLDGLDDGGLDAVDGGTGADGGWDGGSDGGSDGGGDGGGGGGD